MIALAKKRDGVIYDQYTASVNYKKFIFIVRDTRWIDARAV